VKSIKNNKSSYLTITIMVFIVSFWFYNSAYPTDSLLLVRAMPQWDRPYHQGPYATVIYSLNEIGGQLDSLWALEKGKYAWDVDIYPETGNIVIIEDWKAAYLFEEKNIIDPYKINLENIDRVYNCYLCAHGKSPSDLIFTDVRTNKNSGNPYVALNAYELPSAEFIPDFVPSKNDCEIYVPGPTPPFASGQDNVFRAYIHNDIIDIDNPLINKEYKIPDTLIQMDSSFGWVVVSNSPNVMALTSAANRHDLRTKEVLILDKLRNNWRSIIVPGSRTGLRPINSWLVGEVAYHSPGTDFKRRETSYPVLSDSVVFIEPDTFNRFTVQLGDSCEVLWIDNSNNIYYHLADSLFKGYIEGEKIMGRELIMQDPRIREIHWALGK